MPRNGRVVVAVVLTIGLSVGALGSWWLVHARPVPGDYIDALALPDGGAVVIRHQRGSAHDFLEVRTADRLRWRGLIPRYAGSPGTIAVAASEAVVTVRVVRGGHPHLFAFDTSNGTKIASFDLADDAPPDPGGYTLPNIATVSAGARSVEVMSRPGGGARLILVALHERRLAWKVDLPAAPDEVWIAGDAVVARRGTELSAWAVPTGTPMTPPAGGPPGSATGGGTYVTVDGFGFGGGGATRYQVPADAVRPRAYHLSGGHAWVIEPRQLTVLDGELRPIKTIK